MASNSRDFIEVVVCNSWISTLLVMIQGNKRNNLPSDPFLSSWRTQRCKFQVFPSRTTFISYIRFSKRLYNIFPILTVQIDLSATASL